MAACADPTAITGATIITTSPYADQSIAVFQCLSGYVMTGSAFITCNSGTWTTSPSCSVLQTNDVTVNNNDNTNFPTWLSYVIAVLCGIIALLVITCIFVWCLQLFGCYKGGGMFGHHDGCACCSCCRRNRRNSSSSQKDEYDPPERTCKTYPRRYEYDEHGRRYHYDDMGRRCYFHHSDHRNGNVGKVVPDSPASEKRNTVYVSTISEEPMVERKVVPAKELAAWKPHANPVRNINTSTK